MSEFDAFDSEPPAQNTEEDPAAAFLAREQSELAGLEDDNVPQDNGGNLSVSICCFNVTIVRVPPTGHLFKKQHNIPSTDQIAVNWII